MAETDPVVEFKGFKGLRNDVPEDMLESSDLTAAMNVDIGNAGEIRRRSGHTAPVVSGPVHSLWSSGDVCLAVQGTNLVQIMRDFTLRTQRSGVSSTAPMSYAQIGPRLFYSNGIITGVIQDSVSRSWGLPVPPLPLVQIQSGIMRPAGYQYVMTYVRADGQESGAQKAGLVTLAQSGGLSFQLPVPSDPGVTSKLLYLSQPDGEVLYWVGAYPAAELTATVVRVDRPADTATPLGTQFLTAPVPGTVLSVYNGYVFIASGSHLYHTEAYSPERMSPGAFIPLGGDITLVAPVEDGLFVATSETTAFLAGKDPQQFEYRHIADYGAVPGSLAYAPASYLSGDGQEKEMVPLWASTEGVCVGYSGGGFRNVTQPRYEYPARDRGASIVRSHRGVVQCITALHGAERPGAG